MMHEAACQVDASVCVGLKKGACIQTAGAALFAGGIFRSADLLTSLAVSGRSITHFRASTEGFFGGFSAANPAIYSQPAKVFIVMLAAFAHGPPFSVYCLHREEDQRVHRLRLIARVDRERKRMYLTQRAILRK